MPVESNFVGYISIGEGWHNYHHTFPWDYRAAELGSKCNITARIIDLLHRFNLAYDLKTAPYELIQSRSLRTGDGTHPVFSEKVYWKQTIGQEQKEISNDRLRNIDETYVTHRNVAAQG